MYDFHHVFVMWNVEGILLKFEAISCDIEVLP